MIKPVQNGFTIVELLVGIGILGLMAPLLATGMFQMLTSVEKGRAGFEAQADTRNAAAWMSQDIVMAQAADQTIPYDIGCTNESGTFATFTWFDWFGDPDPVPIHTVSYCLKGTELLRFYDCGGPIVIGRHIDPDTLAITIGSLTDPLTGREVTINISSDPARNRFNVTDSKIVRVKMSPMPGSFPAPCS